MKQEAKKGMWKEFWSEYKQAKRLRHYMLAVTCISLMLPLAVLVFFSDSMGVAMMCLLGFMLALLCVVSFIEANTQGIRDRRTVVSNKVYPLKGFVLGIFQQLPFWILTGILFALRYVIFDVSVFTDEFRNYAVNVFMLQYTDIMLLFDYNWLGYLLSFCLLPVICEIGYFLGFRWKIDIDDKLGGIRKR